MANAYEDHVRGRTAEEVLAQYHTADSNLSPYLQIAAQIRSNQELIQALKTASEDSGKTARKMVVAQFQILSRGESECFPAAKYYRLYRSSISVIISVTLGGSGV